MQTHPQTRTTDTFTTRIFTADRVHTLATGTALPAFATVGEWIAAAGTVEELRARFPEAPVHDFGDRTVVPGFNDAHQHPTSMAEAMLHVDLSPERVRTHEQLEAALRGRAAELPSGAWLIGARYDHGKTTGGTVIKRQDLDRICSDRPVMVTHIASHWAVFNSAALSAAGLDDDSEPPAGGAYGRDAEGRLDGVLYEQAMMHLRSSPAPGRAPVVPVSPLADRIEALGRYQRMMHSAGITSVGDAAVAGDGLDLLQAADAAGTLTLRVNALLLYTAVPGMESIGLRTGLGGTRLRIGGVKALVDGAVAGGTCLLEEPYEGTCEHGIQAMSEAELHDVVRRVHGSGGTVCVHANGDRAIRLVLDAVEAAQAADPRPGTRHRIEHCSLVDDTILRRIAALGMVTVPFGSYVAFHGDKLTGWYGAKRLERMFAHRDLLDAGIPTAGSSDYPCGPYEPLLGLQSCVTRQTADGTVLGGNQRITAGEALALYTTGAAYAAGEETVKGRLTPGMLADFTVLDEDPLTADPQRLAAIGVSETWVGAQQVWQA